MDKLTCSNHALIIRNFLFSVSLKKNSWYDIAYYQLGFGVWYGVRGDLMSKTVNFSGKPFHFIGIGGIGMSALAYVLAKRQLPVSGSDLRSSHITKRLQSVGTHIFSSQQAANLDYFQNRKPVRGDRLSATATVRGKAQETATLTAPHKQEQLGVSLPQVICSTAITSTNVEYQAAQEKGCTIFHRSDLLAALVKEYKSIAVAGTHGKTTTSSLIGYMLLQAGVDPTIIVGGEVDAWEGNARLGNGPFLVAEADESDGSLTKISASLGVITNIELDHPDHYQSIEEVVDIFRTFESQCETLVGCLDCETLSSTFQPQISYSIEPEKGADYTVKNVTYHSWGSRAEVWEKGTALGQLELPLLGLHNLSNALAAVAVGRHLGLEFAAIAKGLATFKGAKRRFEYRGKNKGVTFIDDYAHHPSEISVTLTAARLRLCQEEQNSSLKRVIAIFQPHRYSRTLTFLEEFAQAFSQADVVVVTDIYSAGEPNSGKITGQKLSQAIAAHHPQVFYQPLSSLSNFLPDILQPGDLALFLGAGNLNQTIPVMLAG